MGRKCNWNFKRSKKVKSIVQNELVINKTEETREENKR